MTLKAKKREKNILMIRRYEKDRRARFNVLLDKLASLLPDFSEFNTEDQKWTKAQIVENSIKFIKNLQNNAKNSSILQHVDDQQQHPDSAKIIKILKKQNKKLREVLRNEFAPHMTDKDFAHLDFNTLEKLVKEKNHEKLRRDNKPKENDQNALNDAGDVFVVSTEQRRNENCDHNYSVIVHAEAEIEIGEDGDNIQHQDNNVIDDLVVLESSTEPSVIVPEQQSIEEAIVENNNSTTTATSVVVTAAGTTTANVQPIIIQMAAHPSNAVIHQQAGSSTFFHHHPTTIPTVIPLQTATIRPLGAPVSVMPPNKLPLPRNTSTSATGLVNVYSSPVVASQPWRLPKEKRRRKRVVKSTKMKESSEGQNDLPHQLEETSDSTTKESSSGGSKPTEKTASSTLPTSSIPTVNTQMDSDFVRVSASSSLPKAILASQDPEISGDINNIKEQEIVDLTIEPASSPSIVEVVVEKKSTASSAAMASKNYREDSNSGKKTPSNSGSGNKKTKSSYSIAALCQMSVNIGADPAAGVVPDVNIPASGINSPGVVSLNSATESPRATPTPQPTPTAATGTGNTVKSGAAGASSKNPQNNAKKVIQELKPVDNNYPTASTSVGVKSSVDDHVIQPTSPTKNYLTQFPVVKGQQKPPSEKLQPQMTAASTTTSKSNTEHKKSMPEKIATGTTTTSSGSTQSKLSSSKMPSNSLPPSSVNMTLTASNNSSAVASVSGEKSQYHGQSRQHHRIHQEYSGSTYPGQPVSSYSDFNNRHQPPYTSGSAASKNPHVQAYKRPPPPPTSHLQPNPNLNPVTASGLGGGGGPPNFPLQADPTMQHPHHHPGYQIMDQVPPDSFFSVSQMVNPKGTGGQYQTVASGATSSKKSNNKRGGGGSGTSTTAGSSSISSSGNGNSNRYQKQPRIDHTNNKIEQTKKDNSNKSVTGPASASSVKHHVSSRSSSTMASSNLHHSNRGQSSSRSSSTKRSYTAESLLSAEAAHHHVAAVAAASANQTQSSQAIQSRTGPSSHYSASSGTLGSTVPKSGSSTSVLSSTSGSAATTSGTTNRLPEFNWNVGPDSSGHFAPFPSISPSPSLFSQDFGSFDFPMFTTTDMHSVAAHTMAQQAKPPSQSSSRNSSKADSRNFSNNTSTNQIPPGSQPVQQQHHSHHLQQSQQQLHPSQSHENFTTHQDSQQQLFDSNFFTVQGTTLAPPPSAVAAVSGIYSSQEENYGNFTTSGGGGNTMHNPRNYGKSRTSGQHVQQQQQQQGLPTPEEQLQRQMISEQYSSHGQLISNNPPPGGSSYANFNLSTIFPEIHVPGPGNAKLDPAALLPTTPVPVPSLVSSSRSSSSSATVSSTLPPLPSLSSSTTSSTNFISTSSEILPPSIGIFGATTGPHPGQMSFGSAVPFSAANFHTSSSSSVTAGGVAPNSSINFGLHDQQQ